jgi:exopolysaccharide biosynthesis polyprenyl glycosylphosphotransferase
LLQGWFFHSLAMLIAMIALVVRDARLGCPGQHISPLALAWAAEQRRLGVFSIAEFVAISRQKVADNTLFWLLAWLAIFLVILGMTRFSFAAYLSRLQQGGALREAVAIVGARSARDRIAARMGADTDIVGFYGEPSSEQPDCLSADDLATLLELGRAGTLDSVVLAVDNDEPADIAGIVESLKALPVQLAICSDGDWPHQSSLALRIVGGIPMEVVAERPISRRDLMIKTLLDKLAAIVLLMVLAPFIVLISLAVAATSEGPVIFRQTRQGWCGQNFTMFKFRTMRMPYPGAGVFSQTGRGDARCTPVGRILRSTSLDELPQLWNVVLGDMSLVGPRPHVDSLHGLEGTGRKIVAEYAQRYRVKPGMTGWAQIHGARGATTDLDQLRRRVAYDLYYIENWSLWLDLQILARTPSCLIGENVY